jgi:DNA (cytosine-5)-methyltransferase 1
MRLKPPIKVFDFFSGCGGASRGFLNAGLDIVVALDNDADAKATFEANFSGVHFVDNKIEEVSFEDIKPYIDANKLHPLLFSGCAPCQPFTKQNTIRNSDRKKIFLLKVFQEFISHFKPHYIFVENVPGLQNVKGKNGPFDDFLKELGNLNYACEYKVIASQKYGVPQMRRRLVLIASSLGKISFPQETHGRGTGNPEYSTVRDWIEKYPPIEAGEFNEQVPNHRSAGLSETNLRRIRNLSEGGDRRDWPEELRLPCHSKDYDGHTDVYGRMWWDKPASGLTTKCISLSNGRFGHPEQDRAISVREAASLQTFPDDFVFRGSLGSMGRQIGNAVPVLLAQRFGENFSLHFKHYLNCED